MKRLLPWMLLAFAAGCDGNIGAYEGTFTSSGEYPIREPGIDHVFDVIEACGAPCVEIAMITE